LVAPILVHLVILVGVYSDTSSDAAYKNLAETIGYTGLIQIFNVPFFSVYLILLWRLLPRTIRRDRRLLTVALSPLTMALAVPLAITQWDGPAGLQVVLSTAFIGMLIKLPAPSDGSAQSRAPSDGVTHSLGPT
jgi:hypothetical protein